MPPKRLILKWNVDCPFQWTLPSDIHLYITQMYIMLYIKCNFKLLAPGIECLTVSERASAKFLLYQDKSANPNLGPSWVHSFPNTRQKDATTRRTNLNETTS